METFYEIKPGLLKRSAVALGFFDGVHPGHQAVINGALKESQRLGIPTSIATFAQHPRAVIAGQSPQLLTSLPQRLELFASLGVDVALALPFTHEISRLSPLEYVQQVLVGCLGAEAVSVGYNHHFGCKREGNPELLRQIGNQLNFSVEVIQEVFVNGIEVSSSGIRKALDQGDLDLAQQLLSRPYAIAGSVVHGQGKGQQLGFPTANIELVDGQLLPRTGVYAARVMLPEGKKLPAVINIGYRPTVSNQKLLTVEAHILAFNGDLYDQTLTVEFWQFLREEKKFESIDALTAQITQDCRKANEFLQALTVGSIPEVSLPA